MRSRLFEFELSLAHSAKITRTYYPIGSCLLGRWHLYPTPARLSSVAATGLHRHLLHLLNRKRRLFCVAATGLTCRRNFMQRHRTSFPVPAPGRAWTTMEARPPLVEELRGEVEAGAEVEAQVLVQIAAA